MRVSLKHGPTSCDFKGSVHLNYMKSTFSPLTFELSLGLFLLSKLRLSVSCTLLIIYYINILNVFMASVDSR